jgi:hypothetical protein
MKKQAAIWVGILLLLGCAGIAQTGPDRVCEVNVTTPKPGGGKQLEEARKKHNEFHKAEKDKTPIFMWTLLTGPRTGDYLTVSCGMLWKDMDGHDDFDRRDREDIAKVMMPAVASNEASYFIYRPDLSLTPESGAPPTKQMTVIHYFVKPSGINTFTESVKRINTAIKQNNYPSKPSRWYQLVNGGEGPHYVLVSDRNSWSDMQGPDQTLADMLKKAYGDDDKSLQNLRDAVDHTVSELAVYRPDLSYIPEH